MKKQILFVSLILSALLLSSCGGVFVTPDTSDNGNMARMFRH